jgi:hypothetical protein
MRSRCTDIRHVGAGTGRSQDGNHDETRAARSSGQRDQGEERSSETEHGVQRHVRVVEERRVSAHGQIRAVDQQRGQRAGKNTRNQDHG